MVLLSHRCCFFSNAGGDGRAELQRLFVRGWWRLLLQLLRSCEQWAANLELLLLGRAGACSCGVLPDLGPGARRQHSHRVHDLPLPPHEEPHQRLPGQSSVCWSSAHPHLHPRQGTGIVFYVAKKYWRLIGLSINLFIEGGENTVSMAL